LSFLADNFICSNCDVLLTQRGISIVNEQTTLECGAVKEQNELSRCLGLTSAVMIVIGSVVGSGIFLTPSNVAAAVQIPGVMIFVWVLTGLLTLAGAITNAEIASQITDAGGQYVFFRILYNDLIAFLYGWTTFIVYQTGSIAAIAVAFAKYFGFFINLPHFSPALEAWQLPLIGNIHPFADIGLKLMAIAAIMVLAIVNYFGVHFGGFVQNVFTFLKVAAIGGIVFLGFTFGKGSVEHFFPLWGSPSSGTLISAIGVAMIATLWSYDGWNSLTYLAGEVKEPQKTIPRALVLGTVAVIIIYAVTNLAYLYVLPIGEIARSNLVAADMMEKVFSGYGGAIISFCVMISTFGTVNGTSMTTARVYFAMAKDKLFFSGFARVHPKYKTPGRSLMIQGVWASLLTLTGTYDQLFTYVIFAGWIFFALGAVAVFIMRRKMPDANRAFRVPGYPYVPIAFVIVATWFVLNTLLEQTADSLVGLLLLIVGIPFYLYWKRHMNQEVLLRKQP
jgi:basic amino acid/polyamine antiporter, APA family